MRIGSLVILPLYLLAFAATAQTAAPAASDQWKPPTPAASVAAAHGQAVSGDAASAKPSPFKFKQARKSWEPEPPPPRANDKAAVMGTERAWLGGKPPVSCAQTPQDPACR